MVNIIERLVVYVVARSGDTRNCVASWWYSHDTIFGLNLVNLGASRWRHAEEARIKCICCR